MPRKFPWANFSDEKILQVRLKDLNLRIEGTWLEDCVAKLDSELEHRGIGIRPHVWLSDEWFSPNTTPGIAIPFYLAHPRLMRLERKKILEVEGGTPQQCMRILRHEAGHVVQHAYHLNRRRRWQQLFGRSSTRYPSYYRPNPASRNHVQHLHLWYAQSHPDEDFAETFAVWLGPRTNWRNRYAGWPALKKLEYVDELMADIAQQKPELTRRFLVDPISRNTKTLGEHYERRQAVYLFRAPQTYDRDLRRLFSESPSGRRSPAASTFLRKHRAEIRRIVAHWTGEHQLTLDSLLGDMIARCRELDLRAVGSDKQLKIDFMVWFTAKAVHTLHGAARRRWFAL
jgi:hypothetical protein